MPALIRAPSRVGGPAAATRHAGDDAAAEHGADLFLEGTHPVTAAFRA